MPETNWTDQVGILDGSGRTRAQRTLPDEMHVAFVDAMFNDPRSLFVGSIGACLTCLISAYQLRSQPLFVCTGVVALVGVARAALMFAYRNCRPAQPDPAALHPWELAYTAGAGMHVALLGLFLLLVFGLTDDAFVQMLNITGLLAYLIGVANRNFANLLLVKTQILFATVPMMLALPLKGAAYALIVVIVIIPFALSLLSQAIRQRKIYVGAIVKAHSLNILARRFDTALNNMPHGLAMFQGDGTLVVANGRFSELLRLKFDANLQGVAIEAIIAESATQGLILTSQVPALVTGFNRGFSGSCFDELLIDTQTERTLSLRFQPMERGGSVVVVEDITERRNAEARIRHLARYDPLTGLPNRVLFQERSEAALLAREACAVLFIDLDNFKQVNDVLGHSRGDKLLCEVARRMLAVVGSSDLAARFGGDEFVVLRTVEDDGDDPTQLARTIIKTLSQPYMLDGHDVALGASIGIALAPRDGSDIDRLLKNADIALYRAKLEGRGTWRFFEPSMDVQARERRELETDLRQALAKAEFEVFYQPLYNLKERAFSVCEALVRWRHPQRGLVSPAEFVPVAEEMGLIVDIGAWVLQEACRRCATWPANVRVAVNISPLQFRRGGIVTTVKEALAAAKLPPRRLEIEITESVLLQNLQLTRVALYQLRELGVRISLDDFGTGYSSLSYLHSLPLQKVKIDRSFLQGLGAGERSSILLHGVARLSAELGMEVVVEGVETQEQLDLLESDPNVDEVQGYLFSRPIPNADLIEFLAQPVARVA